MRFQRHDQEYKTPLNFRIAGREIPIGLMGITMTLFFVAMANLVSKRVATISGVSFMLVLFAIFTISERLGRKEKHSGLEQFNLQLAIRHFQRVDRISTRLCPCRSAGLHPHDASSVGVA
jgi:hypothetical protein